MATLSAFSLVVGTPVSIISPVARVAPTFVPPSRSFRRVALPAGEAMPKRKTAPSTMPGEAIGPSSSSSSSTTVRAASNEAGSEEVGGVGSSASLDTTSPLPPPPTVPTFPLRTVGTDGRPCTLSMPAIGLGTYKFKKGSGDARRAVLDALSVGYRRVDTAFVYGGEKTEAEVGEALSMSSEGACPISVRREDVFLTTKQWRAYHGYDATLECLDLSLKRLRTTYVDLYLIHWPGPAYTTPARRNDVMESSPDGPFAYAREGHSPSSMTALRSETWRAMEDALLKLGKVRAIGLSNFTVKHLEALKKTARVWPPAVNQVEVHPYNPQTELMEYCRKEGIVVEAYASLGGQDCGKKTWRKLGGSLLEREEVRNIAQKHGRTAAQVLLRWSYQRGCAVIPKSTKVQRMRENLEALSEEGWRDGGGLDDEDMAVLEGLDATRTEEGSNAARLCWVRDPLRHLDFE